MNPTVDWFFKKESKWQREYDALRKIALSSGLNEELKWGCPCYTYNGANIVLIHGFKIYCALLFHKGVLLNDEAGILIQQTTNVQSARQIRFTGLKEINGLKKTILTLIRQVVEVEKNGMKVEMKKTDEYIVPVELLKAFDETPGLRKTFYALTPGRQRGYLLHFSQAKQPNTREARVKRNTVNIFNGKGLNDHRSDYLKK